MAVEYGWSVVDGVLQLNGISFAISSGGILGLADGSAAAPSLAFTSAPTVGIYNVSGNIIFGNGGTGYVGLFADVLQLKSTSSFEWSSTTIAGASDLKLFRDAANTLAQRNGTNAQGFNIYNSISGADKEYLSIAWSGNTVLLHTIASGAGINRDLAVGTNGAGDLYLRRAGANTWKVAAVGGHLTGITATAGLGYGAGAGGAITQLTSRTTGVLLNTVTGDITLFSAAGSATPATFTVTNSTVAITDNIIINQKSGTDLYNLLITNVAAGSFKVTFFTTGGTTTEQPVFHYSVIKGVNA